MLKGVVPSDDVSPAAGMARIDDLLLGDTRTTARASSVLPRRPDHEPRGQNDGEGPVRHQVVPPPDIKEIDVLVALRLTEEEDILEIAELFEKNEEEENKEIAPNSSKSELFELIITARSYGVVCK